MADLFKEIIPSILQTKQNCMLTDQDERQYPAFLVNRAMSFHIDCVLYANEINQYPSLDKKLQYDFLLNTIKPYKRPFKKWLKREVLVDLAVVKEYYGYSDARAMEALRLLSDDQITSLKRELDKGE